MNAQDRLKKLFTEQICALDIASPLPSFDGERDAVTVGRIMDAANAWVAGIRTGGLTSGWVRREDLTSGRCQARMRLFRPGQLMPDDGGLHRALEILGDEEVCFLGTLGQIHAFVTPEDIQKPAARMWLFGMITILEMFFSRAIEARYPDEAWVGRVTPARLQKARRLLEERQRRGERQVRLLDCLQLAEKALVLIKDDEFLAETQFESRRAAKITIKRLDLLRNRLAHSQELVLEDWPMVIQLVRRTERILWRERE
jgi:hypothetical protein